MSDLQVVAVIAAKPGSEDVVRGALNGLVEPTRAEDGCLAYALYESASAPGTFVTVETWRGQEDLDAHLRTPHVTNALTVADGHLAGTPGIHPLRPVTD